ncbi:MAG: cation:proton antiporter, partial [Kocuria sp.]|nr:cation:proton antiporter [Kocuria sp.]
MLLTCLFIALLTCFASPLIIKFLGRNAGWVLALPLLGAAALATSAFADAARSGSPVVEQWAPWMPTVDVGLGLRMDGLALVFTLLVLVIGAMIMVYSTRYLEPGGKHGTFYLLMTGFAAAMLALVLADDLIV